mgnify:CR=1 FL=1
MAPKIIHYCWFGGKPLPELAVKCIDSWKKYFPDYEIRKWDESSFDINCCAYVREAYEAEKWAFVSDYARFWILYHEGGIYFDTDVETLQSFGDILEEGAFMGCESQNTVAPGLGLGAAPGLTLYREMLEFYEGKRFLTEEGKPDTTTVVTYMTELLRRKGFRGDGSIEFIDGIRIYPKEYFCPLDYDTGKMEITQRTHSIHYYNASWLTEEERRVHRTELLLKKRFGGWMGKVYRFPYRVKWKIRDVGLGGAMMLIIEKIKGRLSGG